MLRSTNETKGYAIGASDGPIGHVVDLFIDDADWTVRHLVVQTGGWVARDRVLISPSAVGEIDRHAKTMPVSITREQVRHSPDVDTHMPVSRQHEIDLSGYYGFGAYWDEPGLWGPEMYANPWVRAREDGASDRLDYGGTHVPGTAPSGNADPHLRSANELEGYALHAADGDIGHVRNLLVEDHTWAVRYLVIELGHWWHGRSTLVPPSWIEAVDWERSEIRTGRTRADVRAIPAFDPGKRIDERAEKAWLEHFSGGAG